MEISETDSRGEVARGWGRQSRALAFNGDRVSVSQEMKRALDVLSNSVNTLNTTKLST